MGLENLHGRPTVVQMLEDDTYFVVNSTNHPYPLAVRGLSRRDFLRLGVLTTVVLLAPACSVVPTSPLDAELTTIPLPDGFRMLPYQEAITALNSATFKDASFTLSPVSIEQIQRNLQELAQSINSLSASEREKIQHISTTRPYDYSLAVVLPQIVQPRTDRNSVTSRSTGKRTDVISITPKPFPTQLNHKAIEAALSHFPEVLAEYNSRNPSKKGEIQKRKEALMVILPIGAKIPVIPHIRLFYFETNGRTEPLVIISPPNVTQLMTDGKVVSQALHTYTEFYPPDDPEFDLVAAGPYIELAQILTASADPNQRQANEDRGNSVGLLFYSAVRNLSYEKYVQIIEEQRKRKTLLAPEKIEMYQFDREFYEKVLGFGLGEMVERR